MRPIDPGGDRCPATGGALYGLSRRKRDAAGLTHRRCGEPLLRPAQAVRSVILPLSMSNENERIKLKATFWNNLAVAAITAGIVIPIIAAYRDDAVWNATVFPVFSETAWRTFSALIPGIALGAFFRWYANDLMKTLKD
jgi:hypothetical protein